jgi:hypothetical protein
MAIKDFKFYATELKSEECFCGKTKKPRMSFCYRCYKSLPGDMQKDLYQPLGNGYEEAYEEAVAWLT